MSDKSPGSTVMPILATPAQLKAEQTLLRILQDSAVKRLQAELIAELAATPRGKTIAGAATLARAVEQWTCSLLMGELTVHQSSPHLLWTTDDTPHSWLGYDLPGIGTSGDNPDAIYRAAVIDGAHEYELLGQFDVTNRPAQITIELHRGAKTTPPALDPKKMDLQPLGGLNDDDLQVAADGSFRVTVGPRSLSPVHLTSQAGQLTLGIRTILSNWQQTPTKLEVRSLDNHVVNAASDEQIIAALCKDLPGYVRFWADFPNVWLKGLTGNSISPVQSRNGPLAGFLCGLSYELADDQAILITMVPGAARYTGFQIMDPWMIAPDARAEPVCLNLSQSTANADGSFTYVISRNDPGVANWLATGGINAGIGLLRWQNVPNAAAVDIAQMVRDFQLIKLSDLPSLPLVTPQQRAQQIRDRVAGYERRTRA